MQVKDMIGQRVQLQGIPKRIVSLVPSQTEYLIDLGAPVVARTNFCIHPSNLIEEIPKVGGTKNFRIDKIRKLEPDLIVCNKEENHKAGVDQLTDEFPVWISNIEKVSDAMTMMHKLGVITNREQKASSIISSCQRALTKVSNTIAGTALYLIWSDPIMIAGRGTFINSMLQHIGYQNLARESRYPKVELSEIEDLNPDHLLLSSEPYSFNAQHMAFFQAKLPSSNVQLVDGELFSWYGSRLRLWES